MLTASNAPQANFNAAFVLLECISGELSAAPGVIVDGTQTMGTQAVHPGDLIKATVVNSASATTATLADLTAGHTFTLTKSGIGWSSIEEFIIDDSAVSNGAQLPVANFGTISFRAATVSGKPLGSVYPGTAVDMQSTSGVLQIATGPPTGARANTFTTTWIHS